MVRGKLKLIKTLIVLIILIIGLQSLTRADDINEFEIEGISIGDSALHHFSEEYLMKGIQNKSNDKNEKFLRIWIRNKVFESFEYVAIAVKSQDPKYMIYGITGMFDIEEKKECLDKKEIIEKDIKNIFVNAEISKSEHAALQDKTGKSKVIGTYFYLNNGSVSVQCYLFTKESNIKSGLDVAIRNTEYTKWLESLHD